jgi:hypothetical protein
MLSEFKDYDPSPPFRAGFRTSGSRVLPLRVGVMVSNSISSRPGGTLCSEHSKAGFDPATPSPRLQLNLITLAVCSSGGLKALML